MSGRTWNTAGTDERPHPGSDAPETRHVLGEGGLGRVLAVHDPALDRVVARKELLRDAAGARAKLLREARITALLEHPAIVPIYAAGTDEHGAPWYTMKRIEGRSLQTALEAAPDRAARLAYVPTVLRVCEALAFAHAHGVRHRDLKPDNVMLGPFGETRVVDWGLAVRDGEPEAGVVGSPGFMSPEQARGEPTTAASDVWSLGAVLYALVTGTPPHAAATAEDTLALARTGTFRPLGDDVPADLAAVVHQALAVDPARRYRDAGPLAADLQRWLDGHRVSARRYAPGQILRQEAWNHRGKLGVAGAFVALLASAGVGWLETRRRAAEALEDALVTALTDQARASVRSGDLVRAGAIAARSLALRESPEARGIVALAAGSDVPLLLEAIDAGGTCTWLDTLPDGTVLCRAAGRLSAWRDGVRRWVVAAPDGPAARRGDRIAVAGVDRVALFSTAGEALGAEAAAGTPSAVAFEADGTPMWAIGTRLGRPGSDQPVATSSLSWIGPTADGAVRALGLSGAWFRVEPGRAAHRSGDVAWGVSYAAWFDADGNGFMGRHRTILPIGPDGELRGAPLEVGSYPTEIRRGPDGVVSASTTGAAVVLLVEGSPVADRIPSVGLGSHAWLDDGSVWVSSGEGARRFTTAHGRAPWRHWGPLSDIVATPDGYVASAHEGGGVVHHRWRGAASELSGPSDEPVLLVEAHDRVYARLVVGATRLAAVEGGEIRWLGYADAGVVEPLANGNLLLHASDREVLLDEAWDPVATAVGEVIVADDRLYHCVDPVRELDPADLEALGEVPGLTAADCTKLVGTTSDGGWMVARDGGVRIDRATGERRPLSLGNVRTGFAYAPDRFVFARAEGTLVLVDGERVVAVVPGRGARVNHLRVVDDLLVGFDWEGGTVTLDPAVLHAPADALVERFVAGTGHDWRDGRLTVP